MHSEAIISHNLSLTAYRAYTTYTPILAPEWCLLEHLLEDGTRSGVPRRAAGNRSPREAPGPRPPGTMTRMRGARCDRSGRKSGEGSAAPGPKIATVERREAGVPRQGTQGASQAPGVSEHAERVLRKHPTFFRRSAHPSFRVREAKGKPRAQRGNEKPSPRFWRADLPAEAAAKAGERRGVDMSEAKKRTRAKDEPAQDA